MKILITCVLACFALALGNDYTIKVKNDGSTVQGGTIHFVAEVFDNGVSAVGPFRYEWVDNTLAQHAATHDSNSNKDEWAVSYTDKSGPGSYETTVTVKKLFNFAYVPIAIKQSSFSVTRHLHGAFLVSTKATDTEYIVTHKIVLTTPNTNYLEENSANILTYWYVDGIYYAVTNGLTFTMKYPKLYRRIGIQALVVAQLQGTKTKVDTSQNVYEYIDNFDYRPIINHYSTCNESFPFVTTNNDIEVNENTILGCFTRAFRLWDSLVLGDVPWQQPLITSGSLDGIDFARDKMLYSQNWELEHISDPFVKTIVSDRIDAINRKVPFLAQSNPIDYTTLEARMQRLKEAEKMGLDRIKDPYVKSVVEQRMNDYNKKIPHLEKSNVDERLSNSLDAVHRRFDNIKKLQNIALQKVTNPIAKAALIKRFNEENKRLSMKSKQIDSRFEESLENIHKRMAGLKNSQLATDNYQDLSTNLHQKTKQKIKTPKLLKSNDVTKTTAHDVSQRIEDLKNAENMALNRIDDPTIKAIVLDRIHEQNKKIPLLLKLETPEADISVLDAIHSRINSEIQKSSDVSLDGIKDPVIKETVINKIDKHNEMLKAKSKDIDKVLEVPLSEIRSRIKALKDAEDSAIESVSDPDTKEEVISTIDKENEKIPVLMLPLVMSKNFSFVLDIIRSKMGDLANNEALLTRNVTDPIIQSMIASKFDKVNSILNTKFKLLSDSFSNVLDAVTASVDEPSDEPKKTPLLTKTLDSKTGDLQFPVSLASNFSIALDAINSRINDLKNTTDVITKNITIPVIQELVASKFDKLNTILTTKYKELSDNFTSIIDAINAKLANITLDSKSTKKPSKFPKLQLSSDLYDDDALDETELITNFTVALDTLRAKIDDLQSTQDVITQNITNPFAQSIVASKFNMLNFILNSKYKQLSDNFTNILNTISDATKKTPKLTLSLDSKFEDKSMPSSLASNFTVALDAISTKIDDLKNTSNINTQNITNPAIQAIVASKLDKVSTILSTKYQELSDNFTSVIDLINEKLTNATINMSQKDPKKSKKVPKLTKTLDAVDSDYLSDPSELITNFTIALDAIRTKIDDLKNANDVITQNITNPFAQSIVANKLNMLNFLLNSKYKQLSDNFTNILNTISEQTDTSSKITPRLTLSLDSDIEDLSMPASLASNFSIALDTINTRIDDLKNITDIITQNITNPAVQALVASKLDKVNTILSTKYKELSDNFTSIIDIINEKLTNATADISQKESKKPKKVPKLGKTLDDVGDDYLSNPSDVITNFTIALDAIRTRIDDLKNTEDVITQNITNPFAQAIVATKLDRINFILKTKYKQLNDNFTNIMDTINSKLVKASTDESGNDLTGVREIPKLMKTFDFGTNFSTVIDAVRTKITGKQKPIDATVKYIKDPAIKEVVMNKIMEENKNLSTIADSVEANLTTVLEEFNKKAKDLNTLEDLTLDYIDDPNLQASVINQIAQENDEIPLLSLSKRDAVPDKPVQYTPSKSMFKMKYPTVIRF
ncbi:hypothetical protein RN001_009367 [Aquatica leii]|uniref:Uncharacterized protein n=1 Tax=Aquatica leii TaxID=1421715 RepID=A0AAN7P8M1_9COLE|nr:hypothetical protein RN001_009367 [Aquatica leii]